MAYSFVVLICLLLPAFFCDAKADDCPEDWNGFGDKCYRLSTATGTWWSGNARCRIQKGNLAQSKSAEINDFLTGLLQEEPNYNTAWIGLHYLNGTWSWIDDDEVTYSNFGNHMDDSPFCAALHTNGTWHGVEHCFYRTDFVRKLSTNPAQYEHPWICEMDRGAAVEGQ